MKFQTAPLRTQGRIVRNEKSEIVAGVEVLVKEQEFCRGIGCF